MADSREPYVWNELDLYVWQGGSSALMGFAENVELDVEDNYTKFLFMTTGVDFGGRSQDVLTDRNVQMRVGRLFAGASLFKLMESAVNISAVATMIGDADQATARFSLYSARISHFQAVGREGQLWRDGVTIRAPDISGL